MTDERIRLQAGPLENAIRRLFVASGSPKAEAHTVAARLVASNLRGHHAHGVIRVPVYLDRLRQGWIVPGRIVQPLRDAGAICLLSAGRGYGQSCGGQAMEYAIERARKYNVSATGLVDVNHLGRLADYAVMAVEVGMIGMLFTTGGGVRNFVAPFGAIEGRLSTNPIAVGFPSGQGDPVVFDMSTSALAASKFRLLMTNGEPAPADVLIDKEGRPSIDPADLFDGGALLPLGGPQGYKGTMLSLWVEVLAGLLTGAGAADTRDSSTYDNSTMIIVVNVAAFRELASFEKAMDGFIAYLKASRTAPGMEILYPGENAGRRERNSRTTGIPLGRKTIEAIQDEFDRYGVNVSLDSLAAGKSV